MKAFVFAACFASACFATLAHASPWEPQAPQVQLRLWPGDAPGAKPLPGPETVRTNPDSRIGGKTVTAVTNVSVPTLTVYPPKGGNTGAAVVVFPGGGFQILAIDLEGTDVCDWLTDKGVTCVLLKYRVPSVPYVWQCDCRPHNLAVSTPSLQDAQRALGLVRLHAAEWKVDPKKVGVLGFSAGGFLVAEVSTRFGRRAYAPIDAADRESIRPDFAVAIYPGHLATEKGTLNPTVHPPRDTPPTFVLQAEDDHVDGIEQAQAYYAGLKDAGVPVEMHLYAQGGHAFGLRPTALPITHWPALVDTWLQTIGMTTP